ncbi:MAG: heavy metal translocating P-type ATPase [Myxococcales bacterium]|nr:heavy metal translocating P-type ATPase [Myxococcales bacterium]
MRSHSESPRTAASPSRPNADGLDETPPVDVPAGDDDLILHYALAAASVGLVPVASVDLVSLGAVQLKMVHALCQAHEVPFTPRIGRAAIAALAGAGAPLGVMGILSAVKLVPVFGSTAGMAGMWLLGGASTYALGNALQSHFEAGGTLEDLDVSHLRRASARWYREGLRVLRSMKGRLSARLSRREAAKEAPQRRSHEPPAHGGAGHRHDERGRCLHEHDAHGHVVDHVLDHDSHRRASAHDHGDAEAGCCSHDHSTAEIQRYRGRVVVGASTLAGLTLQRAILPGIIAPGANFAVAAVATVATGSRYLRSLVDAVQTRSLNTDVLVGTATLASLLLGQGATALAVVVLLNLGEWAEALTLEGSRRAIEDLLDGHRSDKCTWIVEVDGEEIEIETSVASLSPGDVVRVRQGQRVPADGTVLRGHGDVDQTQITGESQPSAIGPDATVYAGSVLVTGELRIRCDQVGAESVIGQISRMVRESERNQPRIQRAGETFAQAFLPLSFGAAGLVLVTTLDPIRALTMLLIACPCAVGLSTPTAVSASVGAAARRGMLTRGGQYLEGLAEAEVFVFDKTGTLTQGASQLTGVAVEPGWSEAEVLTLAAAAESHAEHPIARAITASARERGLAVPSAETFELIPGGGVCARVTGCEVHVGSPRLLEGAGIRLTEAHAAALERSSRRGEASVFVAIDGEVAGLITLQDRLRDGAAEALRSLAQRGRRVIIMSGDHEAAVAAVADTLGIAEWHAGLLPLDKRARIEELRRRGLRVVMVGDGINDAPALAAADVGVSLGTTCAELAVNVADVAIASDDLETLAELVALSRSMTARIKENYGLSIVLNSGGMVLAWLGWLGPIGAVVLHNVASLAVIGNSYRITYFAGRSPQDPQRTPVAGAPRAEPLGA